MKNFITFYLLIMALPFLAGCNCKGSPSIRVLEPINPSRDYKLSCTQLGFAIEEAKFYVRSAIRKYENQEAYSESIKCFIPTSLKISRAMVAAEDRLDFLETIYKKKNCSQTTSRAPITIKNENYTETKLPLTFED